MNYLIESRLGLVLAILFGVESVSVFIIAAESYVLAYTGLVSGLTLALTVGPFIAVSIVLWAAFIMVGALTGGKIGDWLARNL